MCDILTFENDILCKVFLTLYLLRQIVTVWYNFLISRSLARWHFLESFSCD